MRIIGQNQLAAAALCALVIAASPAARAESEPRPPHGGLALPDEGEAPDDTDARDSRRFEWLRLHGGVGYQRVVIRTLFAGEGESEQLTAQVVPEDMSGPATQLGVGVKLWFVTLGVTGRVAQLHGAAPQRDTSELQLWSLDGEVAFRAPLGRVEPFVLLGAGYSTFGGMGQIIEGLDRGLDIDGANLRGGLGLDWYLHRHISLRLQGGSDVLFLARRGVPARELAEPREIGTLNEAQERLLEADGASAGLVFDLGAGVGIHF
jgi:hypothetical protein